MPNDEKPRFKPEKSEKMGDYDPLETRRFVIRHMDMEQGNEDFPIFVNTCDNATGGALRFAPGQEVELTRTQVNILKNAVVESSFVVGDIGDFPSQALAAEDPVKAAQAMYPDFTIRRNKRTGELSAHKYKPRFSVEPVVSPDEERGWAA